MSLQARTLALGALAALAGAFSVQAQCYEPLTGSGIGTGDDTVLGIQALGFAFPFNGTTYTDVHVSTNGFVYLSNAGVPAPGGSLCCAGTTAGLVAGSPNIAPYWSDLNMIAGTGQVKYNALPGKAVITWENAVEFGNAVTFSVQLQLLATGEIYFAYDGRCAIRTAGDFLVGMSEGGGVAVPTASDFSSVNTSTTATAFELFNNTGLNYDLSGFSVLFVPSGLGYTWVPQQCASSVASYGSGCYNVSDSWYSRYADAALASAALQGQSVQFIPTTGSYLLVAGGGTYVPPSPAAVNLTATAADDLEVVFTPSAPFNAPQGPQTQLRIHTNGLVSWGAAAQTFPGTSSWTPTAAGFLNAGNAGIYFWHDYNEAEAGSGRIKREEVGGVLYITWDNVENYSTPAGANPGTVQAQLDLATGSVTIVWPTVDTNTTSTFGSAHLVGYTAAGSSNDTGSQNLASLPFLVPTVNQNPLTLSGTTPIVGGTVTYTTNNIPEFLPTSGLYVAINILSLGQIPAPGLDLGLVLGAPGCAALIPSLDLVQSMVGATASQSVTFTYPPSAPIGLQLYSQSAALFTPNTLPNGQNAAGLTTSNGLSSLLGAW